MTCRVCRSEVVTIVDLGHVPLANDFDTKGGSYPLQFGICKGCGLLQIEYDVPPEEMFCDYPWVAGTSRTAQQYAQTFARSVADDCRHIAKPFAVEIASNDGLLLGELRDCGFRSVGVDPSSAADIANGKGLMTYRDFFGVPAAQRVVSKQGRADVVIARNVVGHVKDPVDLVLGIDEVLSDEGVVYIESPYAGLLRDQLQYDTIFHEHCSYFTITTLATLLGRIGLKIASLGWSPMNGGSFVVKASRKLESHSESAKSAIELEKITKLNVPEGWKSFESAVDRQIHELSNLLSLYGPVAAYGAAAKFMTMLSLCRLTSKQISMVADDNPMKHRKRCPGTDIPVVSCSELISRQPSHVLIGAWNYEAEIMERLTAAGYRGRFISSLPIPRVL
jgi:2-polyprenyl-3-methyl-5-hydroxy-6-metoxy-1,4-benzoquinol methylase